MKLYRLKTLVFALLSIVLLTACSKDDDNKPDKKDADVTAQVVLGSGEKIDFAYSLDNLDFFHGPAEQGNGYIIQLYPGTTVDGVWYSISIDARLSGSGNAGEGSYAFHETLGDDDIGVFIRVGIQSDPENVATLKGYSSEVGNAGGLVITSFSDHHIEGTFSGIMGSQMSDDDPPIKIVNGKFSFDF